MILGRKNNIYLWGIFLYTVVVPLSCSGLITKFIIANESTVLHFSLYDWLIVYLIASITMALAFTPSTFIALCSGYFLGWQGLLFFVPSYIVASVIAYLITGLIKSEKVLEFVRTKPKVNEYLNNLSHREKMFVITGRLSPVLPFAIMNVVFRALKIRFWVFIVIGSLGMLPRSFIAVWTGTQILDIVHSSTWAAGDLTSKIALVALILITMLILFRLSTKKITNN